MPQLLRTDAVRLFEASIQCLQLGIIGLGIPQPRECRDGATRFAPAIGLIGAAAELAVSAAYVQLAGYGAILKSERQYKSARGVIEDFRKLLASPTPKMAVLTKGVSNPGAHLKALDDACRKFRILCTQRAAGLHAGQGPGRHVCVTQAKDVSSFLELLARSERVRPYLANVPHPPDVTVERTTLLSELNQQLQKATTPSQQATLMTQIFLVLPDIPEEEPDWLECFDRVAVAPEKNDLAYLLKVLEKAVPVTLARGKAGNPTTVSVRVDPNDPTAVPVGFHDIRRSFTQLREQFHAYVGTANGRLEAGKLDLPPKDFVWRLLMLGLQENGVLDSDATITAHEAWPHMAGSLGIPGTPGPMWFLVRRCGDLPQLVKQMERAAKIRHPFLKTNWANVAAGVSAIADRRQLPRTGEWKQILAQEELAEATRAALLRKVESSAGTSRRLPPALEAIVREVATDAQRLVGPALLALLDKKSNVTPETLTYWSRTLCEGAEALEDIPALVTFIEDDGGGAVKTAARKALRYIDLVEYGPDIAP